MLSLFCRTLPVMSRLALAFVLCAATVGHATSEENLNYQQTQKALSHAEPQRRIHGLRQLLKLGTAKNADVVYPLLDDASGAGHRLATVGQIGRRRY